MTNERINDVQDGVDSFDRSCSLGCPHGPSQRGVRVVLIGLALHDMT